MPFSSVHSLRWLLLAAFAALSACATVSTTTVAPGAAAEHAEQLDRQGKPSQAATAFLELADATRGAEGDHFRLRAAEALVEAGDLGQATDVADDISRRRLSGEDRQRLDLVDAAIALDRHDPARAQALLAFPAGTLPPVLQPRALELGAQAAMQRGDGLTAAEMRARLDPLLRGSSRDDNRKKLLATLGAADPASLQARAATLAGDDPLLPWIEHSLRDRGVAIARALPHPDHPVGTMVPGAPGGGVPEGYAPPHQVGLLLPLKGPLGTVSSAIRDGFLTAYFATADQPRPAIRIYESGTTTAAASAAYRQAVADGADRVVGPLQRESVAALFAEPLTVPVLALNHPDGNVLPPAGSAEFGLLPEVEGAEVASHMLAAGITDVAIIVADADWAQRAAKAFTTQFESGGGRVAAQATIADNTVDYKQTIQSATAPLPPGGTGGIFISMLPKQARLLLPQLKLAGSAVPVFATSHVYGGSANPGLDRDLDGVEFCDAPWLFTTVPGKPDRDAIALRIDDANGVGGRLFAFGMDAYALLPYIGWMLHHPDAYLDGATGILSADRFGHIHRQAAFARFDNGVAVPVEGALQAAPVPATP